MAAFLAIDVAVPTSSRSLEEQTLKHGRLGINPAGRCERNERCYLRTRWPPPRFRHPAVHADHRHLWGQTSQALTQDGQHQLGRRVGSGFLPKGFRC